MFCNTDGSLFVLLPLYRRLAVAAVALSDPWASIDVVEEDDEFEEFENENWGAEEEDVSDTKQWMDNWEDDDSGDAAFIQKLREQLRSK
eukprot:g1427.t1